MPKGRAIIPCTGTVVKSCPNGIKRLSKSNELGAQHVSPHQTTIKRKGPHLKDMSLPDPISCSVAKCRCEIAQNKKFLNVRYGFT